MCYRNALGTPMKSLEAAAPAVDDEYHEDEDAFTRNTVPDGTIILPEAPAPDVFYPHHVAKLILDTAATVSLLPMEAAAQKDSNE